MNSRLTARVTAPILIAAVGLASAGPVVAQQRDRPVRPADPTYTQRDRVLDRDLDRDYERDPDRVQRRRERNRVYEAGTIPADTIVRVRLDNALNSRTAAVGDRFTATVASDDRSGFPLDTRFEGSVTEVQRSTQDRPGIIDMRFRRAVLPDGRAVALDGRLASLADEDVRRTRTGRIETRRTADREGSKFEPKWVGYGAGAGAVLAVLLGENLLKGAVLGGLGGAVYGYINRDKEGGRNQVRDVTLDRGTEFGIRLNQSVAFQPQGNYRFTPQAERVGGGGRVAGARDEFRYGSTSMYLNGRQVVSTNARPINMNGVLYVPLAPVAQAANMRLEYQPGDDFFVLHTRNGAAEAYTGEMSVSMDGRGDQRLDAAPVSIDGEIFVPTEYLNRVAGMDVRWDRRTMRLDLDSSTTARRF